MEILSSTEEFVRKIFMNFAQMLHYFRKCYVPQGINTYAVYKNLCVYVFIAPAITHLIVVFIEVFYNHHY